MFKVNDNTKQISMIQNDFGEILPITVHNVLSTDILRFIIYKEDKNIIVKDFNVDENNILNFQLTEEESKKLDVGYYNYAIKQYRDTTLVDTLEVGNGFIVNEGREEG